MYRSLGSSSETRPAISRVSKAHLLFPLSLPAQLLYHLLQHRLSNLPSAPRTYAFQPYILPAGSSPFSVFSLHSPTIPLTAFLQHFLVPQSNTISAETYERICPPGNRVVLGLETPSRMHSVWERERFEGKWTKGMKELVLLPKDPENVGLITRMNTIADTLESWKHERCVEVKGDLVEHLLASAGTTLGEGELWEALKGSEGVKAWKWGERVSLGVKSAVETLVAGGVVVGAAKAENAAPAGLVLGKKGSGVAEEVASGPGGAVRKPKVLVGLMCESSLASLRVRLTLTLSRSSDPLFATALHLPLLPRSLCHKAAATKSNFTTFSASPILSDRFPSLSKDLSPHGRETIYLDHCDPPIDRVIHRSGRLRREHPRLRTLFVSGMEKVGWRERSIWREAFEKAGESALLLCPSLMGEKGWQIQGPLTSFCLNSRSSCRI